MHPVRVGAVLLVLLMLGGATIALAGTGGDERRGDHGKRDHKWSRTASAVLRDANGNAVGHVWLREKRWSDEVAIYARANGVPPGFHGFHIHTVGQCTPPFTTAGGHLNLAMGNHPGHSGDLPSLLVNADGIATLAAVTDRFSLDDLRDADGSAVMVHAGPDNYANIPTRYAPNGPDQATLDTGDSGARYACGVVR
jgi:Cu-Zn family superoxide dismutase